jgi:hypothetical protein
MPLIKEEYKDSPIYNKKLKRLQAGGSGIVLLKMYKYFRNLQHSKTKTTGCCVTLVLMDSGYIWSQRNKIKCARGIPGGFRERQWKVENRTTETPEEIKQRFKKAGWSFPRLTEIKKKPQERKFKNG